MTIWRIAFISILLVAVVVAIGAFGLRMQAEYLKDLQHRQAQIDKTDAEMEHQQALKFPRRKN